MFLQILDILRILLVCFTFYYGYDIGFENGYNPITQLHFMIPMMIVSIAGISGIEGLLSGKKSAMIKGYEVGSNYQIQSSIALLSYAVTAIMVYSLDFGIKAELSILAAFVFFFFFSAMNHGIEAVKNKNYKWQNINRPFLILILIAGLYYPIVKVIPMIK